jgi:prolyl 4-hydroxylase
MSSTEREDAMKGSLAQQITPALRKWIVEQARAGHRPEAVLEAMKASGWREDVALDALETVLSSALREQALASPQSPASAPATAVSASLRLPEPLLDGAPASVWAHDREVRIVMSMRDPRVVVFAGLLSDDECDEIVALARERLARSHTVDTTTGDSEINAARTSEGMFFARGEHPVCARLEARIAALVNWPLENGEGLQVLRYQPGAEYKPHYDYFDPAQSGTPVILKRGGQRLATLIAYLNTPSRGGATIFPDVKLEVAPVRGHAVFFSYDRPDPATRSLHGGAPVLEGEKWIVTKWLREGRFD